MKINDINSEHKNSLKPNKNRIVNNLKIFCLCLLIILLLTKISPIFEPIMQFFEIIGLPLVVSGLLYYIINPLIDYMESIKINRTASIFIVFIIFITILTLSMVLLIPKLINQVQNFNENLPIYWQLLENKISHFLNQPLFKEFNNSMINSLRNFFSSVGEPTQNILKNAFNGIESMVSKFTNILMIMVTVPFILFYLLKDGKKISSYMGSFLPIKIKDKTLSILSDVNKQLSTYVRGQVTVAFVVAVMFIVGFSLVGLRYSVFLGLLAGVLNLIPYIGSILATVPAILLAIIDGPKMLIAVTIIFVLEQFIEGRFVSPLILGSQLNIHPITIIFVLLTAGKILGVLGVILGIPIYVSVKVILSHFFEWYKGVSILYKE